MKEMIRSDWKPSKERLRALAGDRLKTLRAGGHAAAWADGQRIRLLRRNGAVPDHYWHERHCEGCEGTVVHPRPGGALKVCPWCRDRLRWPRMMPGGGRCVSV